MYRAVVPALLLIWAVPQPRARRSPSPSGTTSSCLPGAGSSGVKAGHPETNDPGQFESTALHREKIPPGAATSFFVGPLNPGRYEFSTISPGDRGAIVVR
jgi:hypothetical protein